MSFQAQTWAAKQVTGSASRKAVLTAVANYADEDGVCWPSQRQLAEDTELSVETVARSLKKLDEDGFLKRERRHRKVDGSRTSDRITLSLTVTEPTRQNAYKANTPEPNCHGDGARIGKPILEPTKEQSTRTREDEFKDFYSGYPNKVGKPRALRAYLKARKQFSQDQITTGLRAWCQKWRKDGTEKNFIPHPSTWLNEHRFNDLVETHDQSILPEQFTADQWRQNLRTYRKLNHWPEAFGPPPGAPGCKVPPEILNDTPKH